MTKAAKCGACLSLGACLSIPREPRWLCKGADARRAAPPLVYSTGKPRNAADAPCRANPAGADGFAFIHRCRLLIGSIPNFVGSASTEGKSVSLAATRNTKTGSLGLEDHVDTGSGKGVARRVVEAARHEPRRRGGRGK